MRRLPQVGLLIDAAEDAGAAAATERAFEALDELEARSLSESNGSLLHYFRANAWHRPQPSKTRVRFLGLGANRKLRSNILELRRAVRHLGFEQLPPVRRCQILTNLGNALNRIGRFIEAPRLLGSGAVDP